VLIGKLFAFGERPASFIKDRRLSYAIQYGEYDKNKIIKSYKKCVISPNADSSLDIQIDYYEMRNGIEPHLTEKYILTVTQNFEIRYPGHQVTCVVVGDSQKFFFAEASGQKVVFDSKSATTDILDAPFYIRSELYYSEKNDKLCIERVLKGEIYRESTAQIFDDDAFADALKKSASAYTDYLKSYEKANPKIPALRQLQLGGWGGTLSDQYGQIHRIFFAKAEFTWSRLIPNYGYNNIVAIQFPYINAANVKTTKTGETTTISMTFNKAVFLGNSTGLFIDSVAPVYPINIVLDYNSKNNEVTSYLMTFASGAKMRLTK
jgi:hypothetical protein